MAATTIVAPTIGIAHVGTYQVKVQVRPGGKAAWLTLLGRSDYESFSVGTINDLNDPDPDLRVFQRMHDWATPRVRQMLIASVTRLYREYEAEHRGA